MRDMADPAGVAAMRGRRRGIAIGVTFLAIVAIWSWQAASQPVEPRTVQGWARPSAEGAAIGLFESPDDDEGEGYIIAGARWAEAGGAWHDGATEPSCVGTNVHALAEVELGVVDVRGPEDGKWSHVVWLRCL